MKDDEINENINNISKNRWWNKWKVLEVFSKVFRFICICLSGLRTLNLLYCFGIQYFHLILFNSTDNRNLRIRLKSARTTKTYKPANTKKTELVTVFNRMIKQFLNLKTSFCAKGLLNKEAFNLGNRFTLSSLKEGWCCFAKLLKRRSNKSPTFHQT